jgi:hypothetical protein
MILMMMWIGGSEKLSGNSDTLGVIGKAKSRVYWEDGIVRKSTPGVDRRI